MAGPHRSGDRLERGGRVRAAAAGHLHRHARRARRPRRRRYGRGSDHDPAGAGDRSASGVGIVDRRRLARRGGSDGRGRTPDVLPERRRPEGRGPACQPGELGGPVGSRPTRHKPTSSGFGSRPRATTGATTRCGCNSPGRSTPTASPTGASVRPAASRSTWRSAPGAASPAGAGKTTAGEPSTVPGPCCDSRRRRSAGAHPGPRRWRVDRSGRAVGGEVSGRRGPARPRTTRSFSRPRSGIGAEAVAVHDETEQGARSRAPWAGLHKPPRRPD